MAQDLLKKGEGSFFRGNLHCHSNRSDGLVGPRDVATAYRDAGYDFICLSDHFEAEYGWQITDTRHLRDEGFTTIVGAELSSAAWTDRKSTRLNSSHANISYAVFCLTKTTLLPSGENPHMR